jgi:TRAP-type C4-dicarboxylate transport system substrate-binding protein
MSFAKAMKLLVVAAAALGASAAHAADEVVLKFHHFLPPSSNAHQNLITPWCDKIAKESNGKMKCQIYPAMQLGGTPPQLFDQARDGVADVVWTLPTYQAGRFTKSEVFELPFMVKTGEKGSPALWEYVQKHSLDEFKGTKVILMHMHDGAVLHFSSKPVKVLADLKGLKIRAPTRIASQMLSAWGAVPVQMPAPQVPEAISKGVVDGVMFPWEVVTPLKIQEVVKYHVDTPAGVPKMSNSIFVVAMNQAKYDSLPPDLKKVIDNNSGLEASRWAGKVFDGPQVSAKKIAHDRGNQFISLAGAEYERWKKAAAVVDDEWIKEVGAKGGNGKALLEDARALIKKYDK